MEGCTQKVHKALFYIWLSSIIFFMTKTREDKIHLLNLQMVMKWEAIDRKVHN